MEHIICKHIHNHLEKYDILTSFQHGFRKAHSCETQSLLTVDDLMRSFHQKIQSDIAILEFSRAFDRVPHEQLLGKLGHYGIRGTIHNWIRTFLYNRQMWVAVDGESACKARVASGVPQGTVLGQLLFLLFINDLPSVVSPGTTTRLFADDCLVYREIKTGKDQVTLQRDLSALVTWAKIWGVQINPAKCIVMRIHRLLLSWGHISSLGQLLHRLSRPSTLGSQAWLGSLGRQHHQKGEQHTELLETQPQIFPETLQRGRVLCSGEVNGGVFFCRLGSTHQIEKDNVERVNRHAVWMVSNDYGRHSSVTSMLTRLGWATLEHVRISGWPWCTKWSLDWWQYPQLILPQQIPAPEPTTVLSFGLSVVIIRFTSIPSFREPFLLGASYQQKPPKLRPSMHSSIVSVVPPFISIRVIFIPGVCRLISRSRSS